MSVNERLKLFIPPILFSLRKELRGIRRKSPPAWEYTPEGWAYARRHPEVRGWNVEEVLDVYKAKWPTFVSLTQDTGPLGFVHESDLNTRTDIPSHNVVMSFAYNLALASHSLDTVTMLDWGGGIGHYYLLAKALLPDVDIEYHCKDLPLLAEYGAKLFPEQHFYSDESCLERSYDLVMANTSIHYAEDWQGLLSRLARAAKRYLYIANIPTVINAASFVFVQRPYDFGYNTEYLAWCLNRDEFLEHALSLGLELQREFVFGYKPLIVKAPEQNEYRGYLFSPTSGAWA